MPGGRPSERGIFEIADDSGNVVEGVNRLRLGPGLTLGRNNNDPSAVIDATGVGGLVSLVNVNTVADLRALSALTMLVAKAGQTAGYSSVNDGGGATYDWFPANTDADDGALTIKVTAVATGRFKFRMPVDRLFPLASCGISGNGISHVGNALTTLAATLYAAGYYGFRGSRGLRYNISGGNYDIMTRTEWYPWIHEDIAWCSDGPSSGLAAAVTAFVHVESGFSGTGATFPLDGTNFPISTRNWTQQMYAGGRTCTGVSDIRNLTVGDPVLVRCGADPSDASGPWWTHHFAHISSITPTTGNAGNIVIDEHVHETPVHPMPAWSINALRAVDKNDLMKVTGFQDNLVFRNCTFNDVNLSCQFGRNLRVENPLSTSCALGFSLFGTIGVKIVNPTYEKVLGINLDAGDPTADPFANYGAWMILNVTRDTEINNLRINRISVAGGVVNGELACRNTILTGITQVRGHTDQGVVNNICGSFTEPPNAASIFRIDYLVLDGGADFTAAPGATVRFGTLVLGKTDAAWGAADPNAAQWYFTRASNVSDCLIFRGNEYRTRKSCTVMCTGITPGTTKSFPIPYNGIIRNIRVYSSTLTGVTHWTVHTALGTDETANLAAGQWRDLTVPALLVYGTLNITTDVQAIKITTDGTWPAAGYFIVDLEIMQNNGNRDDPFSPVTDLSSLPSRVSSGAPSTSADFLGQENFDVTNSVWYKSISLGNGAADWVLSGSSKILNGTVASGNVVLTEVTEPSAPSSGKIVLWADSTQHVITSKDSLSNKYTQPVVSAATPHQWVTNLRADGVLERTRPAAADLSDATAAGISVITGATAESIAIALGVPVKIAGGAVSSASTITVSFTANKWKRLTVQCSWSTGGINTIGLTGMSASTFNLLFVYAITSGAGPTLVSLIGQNNWAPAVSSGGSQGGMSMVIDMPPAPAVKHMSGSESDLYIGSGSVIRTFDGWCTDTTNDPTALVMTFTGTPNVYYTVWGYP